MPAKKKSQKARSRRRKAADALADVQALQVTLEDGNVVEFDLEKELFVPTDVAELHAAARKAPAELAFWGYQTERLLKRVRAAESKLDEAEAKQYLVYRAWYESEECVTPTESMLQARLSQDVGIRRFRVALRARREEYGAVRSVREAVDRRLLIVRTLIGTYEPT